MPLALKASVNNGQKKIEVLGKKCLTDDQLSCECDETAGSFQFHTSVTNSYSQNCS